MADISKIVLPDTSEYNIKDAGAARQDEAICLARAHSGDGILDGCEMEITGTSLYITAGSVIAGGKVVYFKVDNEISLSSLSSDCFARAILNIQLTHNPEAWISLEQSPTTTFDDLTQNDLNIAGNLYQLELCVVQAASSVLSMYSKLGYSEVVSLSTVTAYNNIIIRGNADETRRLWFIRDNHTEGKVQLSYAGNFTVGLCDSSGNTVSGMLCNGSGTTLLYGNGGNITLQPNGTNDNTGSAVLNTAGSLVLRAYTYQTLTPTVSGHTVSFYVYRHGNVVNGHFGVSVNSGLITNASIDVGTLDAAFRNSNFSMHFPCIARSADAWASATYYEGAVLSISSNGTVGLTGNSTNIKKCKHISCDFSYAVSQTH